MSILLIIRMNFLKISISNTNVSNGTLNTDSFISDRITTAKNDFTWQEKLIFSNTYKYHFQIWLMKFNIRHTQFFCFFISQIEWVRILMKLWLIDDIIVSYSSPFFEWIANIFDPVLFSPVQDSMIVIVFYETHWIDNHCVSSSSIQCTMLQQMHSTSHWILNMEKRDILEK